CAGVLDSIPVSVSFFADNLPAPPDPATLSLHDALPISGNASRQLLLDPPASTPELGSRTRCRPGGGPGRPRAVRGRRHRQCRNRSEEHTSELQSRFDLVCRLLLEKKKWMPRAHRFVARS